MKQLWSDRTFMGNMMGSLESWLLLRSLRTLHLRVPRQSATATALAQWLHSAATAPAGQSLDGIPAGIITKVWHSSLQQKDHRGFDPKTQMVGGWNATFAIYVSVIHFMPFYPFCSDATFPAARQSRTCRNAALYGAVLCSKLNELLVRTDEVDEAKSLLQASEVLNL